MRAPPRSRRTGGAGCACAARPPPPTPRPGIPSSPPAILITLNPARGAMARQPACRLCSRSVKPSGRGKTPSYCKRCTAKADREIAKKPRVDCQECGKTFSTRTRSVRYCSDACRTAAARRADIVNQRRHEADPWNRAMKLARARRAATARRARARGRRPPTRASRDVKSLKRNAKAAEPYPCELCGRDFAPYGGARPVHCRRCSARIDMEIDKERAVKCMECGKKFSTPTRVARYCSRACSAAGRARTSREGERRRMADPEARALAAARTRAWVAANRGRKKGRGGRRRA